MGTVVANLGEGVGKALGVFTDLSKVAAPFTTVVNRAQVVDFSNDHLPKFGINRVMFQQIEEVQGETGPNGERVFKPFNDQMDQVRFVGNWFNANANVHGSYYIQSSGTNYLEVTFYGTGLNMLGYPIPGSSFTYSVDGGTAVAFAHPANTSTTTADRDYNTNTILPVVSGLTAGLHTVKITDLGTGEHFYGVDIISSASTLQLVPGSTYNGSRKSTKSVLTSDSYNSNFETGTLGTKGGHVVVYAKADGTIGKALQPTDATALYLTAASHASESVIRTYGFREFGAGRSDDFSYISGGTQNLAFTIDDGTTTLIGNGCSNQSVSSYDITLLQSTGNFLTFTFVGTGFDFLALSSTTTFDAHSVTIDGVNQGSYSTVPVANVPYTFKGASGLPYGTHTVKLTRTAAAVNNLDFLRFIVYGPVKPSIPTGAVELADYYLMANYVASVNSTTGFISSGVLRKQSMRETLLAGTWTAPTFSPGVDSGFEVTSTTAASFASYTFFGTGAELTVYYGAVAQSSTVTVTAVGGSAIPLNTVTTSFVQPGTGLTFTSSTGAVSGTNSAGGQAKIQISGLTLGLYTVKFTQNSTGYTDFIGVDVITPVHSPKSNVPGDLQNTYSVGSQALGDSRKFSGQAIKTLANWSQALGNIVSPTTTSTTTVPVPDMTCIIKTTGNPIEISYTIVHTNNGAGTQNNFQIYVDGVGLGITQAALTPVSGYWLEVSDSFIVPVAAGTHIVQLFWSTGANTLTAIQTRRQIKVREIA